MHRNGRRAPAALAAPAGGEGRWHVAATKPGRERLACEQLGNQDFEVFLPLLRRTVRARGRLEDRREAYFPGYVFLRFDPDEPGWRAVNSTRGVRRLIMAGERPLPLPRGFVEQLRASANADGVVAPDQELSAGDRVRIVAGPFADLIGTLEHMDRRGRLAVLIELLNGPVKLTLDRASLVPAA